MCARSSRKQNHLLMCAQAGSNTRISQTTIELGYEADFTSFRFLHERKFIRILWQIVHRYRIFDQMNGIRTHIGSPNLSRNKVKKNKHTHTLTICARGGWTMCEGNRKYFGILWRDIKLVLRVS